MKTKILQTGFAALFLSASSGAWAGTVLAPPFQAVEPTGPGEDYPASSFGTSPTKIETGVDNHYASRAAKEMDEQVSDDEIIHAGEPTRRPAGLEFSSGTNARPDGGARVRKSQPAPSNEANTAALARGGNPANETVVVSQAATVSAETAAMARKGVQEVSIIAGDLGYFPKTIFVTRDVPVRLFVTGASKNTLCIMMDSFQVRKQVRSQKIEEISFTPSVPGNYRFYCPVNGMEGSLIVKELTTTIAQEGGMSNPSARSDAGGTYGGTRYEGAASARQPASVFNDMHSSENPGK